MLRVENVTKKYGDLVAVNELSFEVKDGEIFGLLGLNGAGKTTTFRMILGLLDDYTGSITIDGKKIGYDITDKIGFLTEERSLLTKLTVYEQLIYYGVLKSLSEEEIDKKIKYSHIDGKFNFKKDSAKIMDEAVSVIDNENEVKFVPYNPYHITVGITNNAGTITEGSEQSTLLTEYLLNKYGYSFNGIPENCEIRINGYEITNLRISPSPYNNSTIITGILGSNMGEFGTHTWFVGVSPGWYVVILN